MQGLLLPGERQVELATFDDPTPGPGDVVIRIRASALCRSDMSLYYGQSLLDTGDAGPVISGHEPAGEVEAVGPGVSHFAPGDHVAVHLAIGCGHCQMCRQGLYQLCPDWQCLGFTRHGGNAEYLVVPERNCMTKPATLGFAAAAVSTDAFGTLFTAAKRLGLSGADTVAIFGLGPMGLAGVLAAKAHGARVIAVDMLAGRLNLAGTLGADETIDPGAVDAVEQIMALTGQRGADAAIDCSGNNTAQTAALDCCRALGQVAFVGEAAQLSISPSEQLIRKRLRVFGHWYFSVAEYDEIARCIDEQQIPLDRLISHRFSLSQAAEAFDLFDRRETEKAVFEFQ